jgi:two-component system OmpR family response regulator
MNKKVLVVEDDSLLQDMLSQQLSKDGWTVSYVKEGARTLEVARAEKPDIILLDLMLPGISGYDILSDLKKDAMLGGIPVIILSNLGQQEDVEKGMKMGAAGYMIKSNFTLDEVSAQMKAILEKK